MKDELAGEVPVAFVVRCNGSQVTEEEIKQYVSKQVDPRTLYVQTDSMNDPSRGSNESFLSQVVFYKRINKVFFTEAIPKAPSGKILRKDLRAKLASPFPSA